MAFSYTPYNSHVADIPVILPQDIVPIDNESSSSQIVSNCLSEGVPSNPTFVRHCYKRT